jgi:hypothetical protein
MSKKTDKALDTTARALNTALGEKVGDAIASAVLAPLRGNTACTCNDPKCSEKA